MLGGTPQGSILSPTLFILLSADAPIISDGAGEDGSIFADDLNIWTSAKKLDDCLLLLQRRIHIFSDWCERWRLTPAPSKSNIVIFSRKGKTKEEAKKRSIYMNGRKIEWTQEVTFLGALYDEGLLFKPHIERLMRNSYGKTRSIKKLFQHGITINQDIIVGLIHSLIFSAFHYSAPAYLGMSPLTWRKVDCFFARTLKIIFGHPGCTNNETIMKNYLGKKASDIIQDQATTRIRDIYRSVPLAADVIPRISDCIFNRPHCSPTQTIIEKHGWTFRGFA